MLFCLDEPNIDLQCNIHHFFRESYTFPPPKKHVYIISLNIISELFAHFLLVKLFPWISHSISIIDWQTLLGLIITQLAVVHSTLYKNVLKIA